MPSVIFIAIGPIFITTALIILFYVFGKHMIKTRQTAAGATKKKTHIIECEKCAKKMRVPTVNGPLKVTCPKCSHVFTHG